LINANLDMKEQMHYIMNRLKAMGITSSYVFFYADGVSHKVGQDFELPETIYLNAYYNEKETVYYKPKHRIPISTKSGDFMQFLQKDKARFYTAYVLFSGEEQYGLILCEAAQKEFPFMLSCSMQLGSLRRIIDMNMREQQMKRELEEKNSILSMISMYDDMSKVLNRRGFMEKALRLIYQKQGQKAYLVFADLDHLKEINDSFGHAAGDLAIITAANYLKDALSKDAVIGRIGGDEYVALFVEEDGMDGRSVTQKIEACAKCFNEKSNEPFYIELSVGIYEFICDEKIEIAELFKHSDAVLYEQKQKRRISIKR